MGLKGEKDCISLLQGPVGLPFSLLSFGGGPFLLHICTDSAARTKSLRGGGDCFNSGMGPVGAAWQSLSPVRPVSGLVPVQLWPTLVLINS
jgi:hypothetical protein